MSCLCISAAVSGSSVAEVTDNAAAVASLADLAKTVVVRAGDEPLSTTDRRDLLAALYGLAGAGPALHSPKTGAALGSAFARTAMEAQRGDGDCISALMMLVVSPYGRTAEGFEWIDELLWEVLADQPQASMESLAELPAEIRKTVVTEIYTAPVHDGFDFPAILEALANVRVPANATAEIETVLETLRAVAG